MAKIMEVKQNEKMMTLFKYFVVLSNMNADK